MSLKVCKSVEILSSFSRYSISETASEEESSVPSCSRLHSESSIPEDLGSLAAESVPSEPIGHGQPESPDRSTINEEMVYSEEFNSSTSPGKLVSELFALHTLCDL